MFCHCCGQKLPDDARFCSKCGTAVAVESAEEETVDLSISEKDREGVYSRFAEVTLDSMDNTTITLEESQDIADFVLDRLDAVKTEPQLLAFILELSK